MDLKKEDIALNIVRWIAKHGVQPYANMLIIPIDPKTKDEQEFTDLIGAYNTIIKLENEQDK